MNINTQAGVVFDQHMDGVNITSRSGYLAVQIMVTLLAGRHNVYKIWKYENIRSILKHTYSHTLRTFVLEHISL
mgnify:CR=1 FL=1